MKNLKRKTLLLALLLIFINLEPIHAKENPKILVNHWALNEIADAQIEGIIKSTDISRTEDFTKEITSSKLKTLAENTEKKLKNSGLKENPGYKKTPYSLTDTTKANLCSIIYDFSLKYDESALNRDKISYLKEKGILNGNGTSMNLNRKCTYEEAVALMKRTAENLIYMQDKASKGIFYKIENRNNTVYLFGSIHIGDSTMYPIDKRVMDAYSSSDELYVEVNLLKDSSNREKVLAKHSDGRTLEDDLGPELYGRYKSLMTEYGISESLYRNFRPWIAYNLLSNLPIYLTMPGASSYGVDMYFINRASRNNKPIKELESSDFQIDLLADFDSAEYVNMIDGLLGMINSRPENIKKMSEGYRELISIWKTGDADKLNRTVQKTDKFTNNLFDDRDIGMAVKIDSMLKSPEHKTYFVVAGSAHFTPEDSVTKILENRGYKVERIK